MGVAVGAALDGLARHWLALAVLAVAALLGLAFAAPVLAMSGHDRLADALYLVFRATCHQLPHRSYFVGGPSAWYDWETVRAHLGLGPDDWFRVFHRPVTDPALGYQVAFCQRDTATFGALLVSLLAFALVRDRRRLPPLTLRGYAVLLVPLALDGGSQLLGLRESNPALRTATGGLFGMATAWLVLPAVEDGFRELRRDVGRHGGS